MQIHPHQIESPHPHQIETCPPPSCFSPERRAHLPSALFSFLSPELSFLQLLPCPDSLLPSLFSPTGAPPSLLIHHQPDPLLLLLHILHAEPTRPESTGSRRLRPGALAEALGSPLFLTRVRIRPPASGSLLLLSTNAPTFLPHDRRPPAPSSLTATPPPDLLPLPQLPPSGGPSGCNPKLQSWPTWLSGGDSRTTRPAAVRSRATQSRRTTCGGGGFEFCRYDVRPEGSEASNMQLIALGNALGIPLIVENLDTSLPRGVVQLNQHEYCQRAESEVEPMSGPQNLHGSVSSEGTCSVESVSSESSYHTAIGAPMELLNLASTSGPGTNSSMEALELQSIDTGSTPSQGGSGEHDGERTIDDLSPAERRRFATLLYRPGHYDILYPK